MNIFCQIFYMAFGEKVK